MNNRCVLLCFILLFFNQIISSFADGENAAKGFAFNNPEDFKEYDNFMGGAGSIRFKECFNSRDFKSNHYFLRVGVIPPNCSIGVYLAVDSEEVFIIMNSHVYVKVNGHIGAIVGESMIPIRPGDTIGIFNPTDENVTFAWMVTAVEKGVYNPVPTGDDATTFHHKPYEQPSEFPCVPLDYGNRRIEIGPAHKGKGKIYDTFGAVGHQFFESEWGLYYLVLPPDTSIGYHQHDEHEEFYFVIKGHARGTVNDVTLDLASGDCIVCDIGSRHGIYNNGSQNLGLITTSLSAVPSKARSSKDLGDDLTGR